MLFLVLFSLNSAKPRREREKKVQPGDVGEGEVVSDQEEEEKLKAKQEFAEFMKREYGVDPPKLEDEEYKISKAMAKADKRAAKIPTRKSHTIPPEQKRTPLPRMNPKNFKP